MKRNQLILLCGGGLLLGFIIAAGWAWLLNPTPVERVEVEAREDAPAIDPHLAEAMAMPVEGGRE